MRELLTCNDVSRLLERSNVTNWSQVSGELRIGEGGKEKERSRRREVEGGRWKE